MECTNVDIQEKICIPLGYVCDLKNDCPNGDDEVLCKLKGAKCIGQCECFGMAIMCKYTSLQFSNLIKYPYVSLNFLSVVGVEIDKIKNTFPDTILAVFLSNKIVQVCNIAFPVNMIYLDLGNNNIYSLSPGCFWLSLKLKFILLDYNMITTYSSICLFPIIQSYFP